MSSVRDTSLLAYVSEVEQTLGFRQQAVLTIINVLMSATNSEIAKALGWSINRVTPRVFELRQLGYVVVDEKRPCLVTGRMAYAWRVR